MLSTLYDSLLLFGDFLDRHNGAISSISTVFVALFTYTIWHATTRLWRSSQRHANNLEASIVEAGRSATAMERVSETLADPAASAAENTRLVREMTERQSHIAALRLRGYLSIQFVGVVPQDNQTGYRFEPRVFILNTGHTPAYKVRHRINANVLSFPTPAEFDFPLPTSIRKGASAHSAHNSGLSLLLPFPTYTATRKSCRSAVAWTAAFMFGESSVTKTHLGSNILRTSLKVSSG